ncbi:S10 family serine carboxypeptidase-like protein [Phyllobacterium myrsinacearum]|uniref:Carboxypeptidase C (Cathepsin A) n=1 Tax=Phyllobacterium myrsinacearum TaxID=28101 RepID=A0A839EBX5_9HYPH|nr:hypothetical protein [Phyllobacterium myrsinacearum]MBA8877463.1 carboxypeptidase C (cathepsin A) [Phyllobacterium myrsinacearum]
MKLRILSLSLLAFLAACNDKSESPVSDSTFARDPSTTVEPTSHQVTSHADMTPEKNLAENKIAYDFSVEDALEPAKVDEMPSIRLRQAAAAAIVEPESNPVPPVVSYGDIAPGKHPVEDKIVYDFTGNGALELAKVDETPSVRLHQMVINGQTVNFTASAGHLIAKAPTGRHDPDQAAIFYMAYTRDDLPHENRPVTFFWNGGPGSSSFFLHMGSWAPQRLKVGLPVISEEAKKEKPKTFPLVDDAETLLDQSDLVFVDPVGTGFSEAIEPHKNIEFWGMDADGQVLRDFITRYINKNNRQNSPKYLYGESYGGIRTPIVANLLVQAGTANYQPDPSGKKPVVLSGVILNSPILDYETNGTVQSGNKTASWAGFLPTLAMIADYYKKGTMRGKATVPEYLDILRKFIKDKYNPARENSAVWHSPEFLAAKNFPFIIEQYFSNLKTEISNWNRTSKDKSIQAKAAFGKKLAGDLEKKLNEWRLGRPEDYGSFQSKFNKDPVTADVGKIQDYFNKTATASFGKRFGATILSDTAAFFSDMTAITGLAIDWFQEFELTAWNFEKLIMPDSTLNSYDARINIPKKDGKDVYDLTFYEDDAFKVGIEMILRATFDYHSKSDYKVSNMDLIPDKWNFQRDAAKPYSRSSLPDLAEILNYDPSIKMLVLHGYYDRITPFHQSEIDLFNVGLADRILVKSFEGGHMTYESEEARVPLKQELDKFYGTPSVLSLQ